METHNAKGVPFDGRAAMRSGWDTKANPWPKDSWERMRWLAEWWFENADCFKSHIEAAEFKPIRLTVPASLYPDAPVSRVFPRFLRTETNTVATFIMEDGKPGPVACLTGDDHEERGRAMVHAVMSSGLTITAAEKLVARLAELEDENRALKAAGTGLISDEEMSALAVRAVSGGLSRSGFAQLAEWAHDEASK